MFHGKTYPKYYTVNNGTQRFQKRVKFCRVHGEIGLLDCGGEDNWNRVHAHCGAAETEIFDFSDHPVETENASIATENEEKIRVAVLEFESRKRFPARRIAQMLIRNAPRNYERSRYAR